ncbi:MAG: hypothetical protein GX409_04850 [candidate division Zixibacteria bacterium]|nr:hypothetical protein [candidate division Zixibacteria bacterium]
MQPKKNRIICNQCRANTIRTWSGYLCPKCGKVIDIQNTINYSSKLFSKRQSL